MAENSLRGILPLKGICYNFEMFKRVSYHKRIISRLMDSPEKNFPLLIWYKLFYESHSQYEGRISVELFLLLEASIPLTGCWFFFVYDPEN